MERKEFIKKGIIGTVVSYLASAFGNKAEAAYKFANSATVAWKGYYHPPIRIWWVMASR